MKIERILKSLHKQSLMSVIKPQTLLIILVAVVVDFASLYTVFNDVLTQNRVFLYILAGAIGFLFALMPVVWVHLYKQQRYQLQHVPTALLVIMPVVFLVIIGVIFWLRYETRNIEFAINQSAIILGGQTAQTEEINNPGALPMSYLLCMVPVLTAVINLLMAWVFDNPLREWIQKLQLAKTALTAEISELKAIEAEYAADPDYRQRMINEENEKYEAINGEIDAIAENYKTYVRMRIAEQLQDPASTSALSANRIIELRGEFA